MTSLEVSSKEGSSVPISLLFGDGWSVSIVGVTVTRGEDWKGRGNLKKIRLSILAVFKSKVGVMGVVSVRVKMVVFWET